MAHTFGSYSTHIEYIQQFAIETGIHVELYRRTLTFVGLMMIAYFRNSPVS